jgi:hypothetical protein
MSISGFLTFPGTLVKPIPLFKIISYLPAFSAIFSHFQPFSAIFSHFQPFSAVALF